MNKPVVGIVVGAILGALDGLTAWFTPDARPMLASILMGSAIKGLLVGIASGFYARRVQSPAKGIVFGAIVGLILAFAVAAMPQPSGHHYYLEIMLPGFVAGGIIGFLTQKWGRPPQTA
jgi:hypothetical protein